MIILTLKGLNILFEASELSIFKQFKTYVLISFL